MLCATPGIEADEARRTRDDRHDEIRPIEVRRARHRGPHRVPRPFHDHEPAVLAVARTPGQAAGIEDEVDRLARHRRTGEVPDLHGGWR
jgi:hypothetical protein